MRSLLIVLAFAALTLLAQDEKPKPRFTVGKKTTFVEGPLDKHGRIDYAAALNATLGKGVTSKNNANAALVQELGPRPFGSKPLPDEYFQALGIGIPPENGKYLTHHVQFLKAIKRREEIDFNVIGKVDAAIITRAWTVKEFPDAGQWLGQNEAPLDRAAEALKRPRYFNPRMMATDDSGGRRWIGGSETVLDAAHWCRVLTVSFKARAMLRLGMGEPDAAWQDLLSCHRLARHIGSGGSFIEQLVGIAIEGSALETDLYFLSRVAPDSKRCESYLADLMALPPMPQLADAADFTERLHALDLIMTIDSEGFGLLDRVLDGDGRVADALSPLLLKTVDWNPALESLNRWYDKIAAAARPATRAERQVKFKELEEDYRKRAARIPKNGGFIQFVVDEKPSGIKLGAAVGDYLTVEFHPAFRKMMDATDRAKQNRDNLLVSFALAWHRADTGHYPVKLADLAPKYLKSIPDDLFSGKALIYETTEKGYLLYSVGMNGKDDGGRGQGDIPRGGDDLKIQMPLPANK